MTLDEILEQHEETARNMRAFAERITPGEGGMAKYQNVMSPEAYKQIRTRIDLTPDAYKKDMEARLESAYLLNTVYPHLTPETAAARANLYAASLGTLYSPAKTLDYLANAIKAGLNEQAAGFLSSEIKYQKDGAATPEQEARLKEINAARLKHSKVRTDNPLLRSLGQTATSLAMTSKGTGHALLMSAEAMMIAAATGAKAGAAIGAGVTAPAAGVGAVPGAVIGGGGAAVLAGAATLVGSLQRSYYNQKVYEGLSYEKMITAGISHEIARPWSTADAAVMVSIESLLSAVPIEGAAAGVISKAFQRKWLSSGLMAASAKQFAARFAVNVVENLTDAALEAGEEAVQAAGSNLMLTLAALEQDRRYGGFDWSTINEYKEDLAEAARGGASMALWFNFPKATVRTFNSLSLTRERAAKIADFVKAVKTQAPDAETRKEIYTKFLGDTLSPIAIDRLSKEDVRDINRFRTDAPAPVGGNKAPFRIGNNGKLRGRPGRDGYTFMDPAGFMYGRAEYDVTDGAVNITGIEITNKDITNPDELKGRVLRDVALSFPDYDITWEGAEGADAALLEAARPLMKADREAALRDEAVKKLAEVLGLQGIKVTRTLPKMSEGERAEYDAAGDRVKGAFLPAVEGLRPERIIYLAEIGDYTTLIHEYFHAAEESFDEAERGRWAAALGLKDNSAEAWEERIFENRRGKEKVNAHEYLAQCWEDYTANPKDQTIPEQLRELFKRIAEGVLEVYRTLGRVVKEVPPEIKALMDELVTEGAARLEAGRTAVESAPRTREEAPVSTQTEKTVNDTAEAVKPPQGALFTGEELTRNARTLYALGPGATVYTHFLRYASPEIYRGSGSNLRKG